MQQRLESGLLSHNESFYPAQPSNPLELAWAKGFAALKTFKAREKHCRVPRGHREGAFNLGTWVVNQRNRKDTLSVQRRRSLEAIGFNWTLLVRDSWEEGFAALKQFKAREGHCQVLEQHEEGSFKLGSWVARQHTKRQTMSTAWRRQLDAIGFVWDPYESEWERGFAALKSSRRAKSTAEFRGTSRRGVQSRYVARQSAKQKGYFGHSTQTEPRCDRFRLAVEVAEIQTLLVKRANPLLEDDRKGPRGVLPRRYGD